MGFAHGNTTEFYLFPVHQIQLTKGDEDGDARYVERILRFHLLRTAMNNSDSRVASGYAVYSKHSWMVISPDLGQQAWEILGT